MSWRLFGQCVLLILIYLVGYFGLLQIRDYQAELAYEASMARSAAAREEAERETTERLAAQAKVSADIARARSDAADIVAREREQQDGGDGVLEPVTGPQWTPSDENNHAE